MKTKPVQITITDFDALLIQGMIPYLRNTFRQNDAVLPMLDRLEKSLIAAGEGQPGSVSEEERTLWAALVDAETKAEALNGQLNNRDQDLVDMRRGRIDMVIYMQVAGLIRVALRDHFKLNLDLLWDKARKKLDKLYNEERTKHDTELAQKARFDRLHAALNSRDPNALDAVLKEMRDDR